MKVINLENKEIPVSCTSEWHNMTQCEPPKDYEGYIKGIGRKGYRADLCLNCGMIIVQVRENSK